MRKTLLTVSALLAGISGTLAYVEKGHAPAVEVWPQPHPLPQ